jgi:2-polyprenyl-6-methoxyphenol hydroxylase-like FAD-dependent oxidoreductase
MIEHAVVVVGGGPTGLMLAGELALAGIDVAIIEKRAHQELVGTRARGLHARTIEVLDQRGIADRFLAQGRIAQVAGFAWLPLDISDFPNRHNYGLALEQSHVERLLAEWVSELEVPIYRAREVTGFEQDDSGVDVALSDGSALRAQYLAGCDGGRSFVRKTAGIAFPGWDPASSYLLAEVELTEEPEWGLRRDAAHGIHALSKLPDGRVSVLLTEARSDRAAEPELQDLRAELLATYGTDYGVHSPTWISRFTDMARQAESYRKGRVLLAGDAAHVHAPVGGQGLNIGVQDAVNLGWKLAQVIRQTSPASLLDTYHSERHPVAARALQNTLAQAALLRADDRTNALRDFMAELLRMERPRQYLGAMLSGLDVQYDCGTGHPLLGRSMPDIDIVTATGALRVFTLLHAARPVLLNFGERESLAVGGWADRVQLIDARYNGGWELPVIGAVTPPSAVLIRPDGHVAWVGHGDSAGLAQALTKWFGPPASAD